MKAQEIREMSAEEIQRRLDEERAELLNMRFQHAVAPMQNPMVLRQKRRDIARLKTLLNEKKQSA